MNTSPFQFVDTNLLVYAHDSSAGLKHEQARTLLQALWRERNDALSIQVLQEFHATVTRKVARPLALETSAQILGDLSVWPVHRPDANDVLAAIQLQARWPLSFWNAMILTSARRLGCAAVWSEDLGTGADYGVLVRNPFT